jgi:tRNA nucleotidyltransferase (CCA-adding enzyme)
MVDPAELPQRIPAVPGMDALLPALAALPPAYLVGGAVRDLLRGATGIDLDVVVEGDARAAARELAARLGGQAVEHERFGTASVRAGDQEVDLATSRRERYPGPGALPEVEPAPLAEDLARRDFTVNAMAVSLSGDELGRLHDPHGGAADLEARTIRVLHDRSFLDDPTRLLRGVRYEVRLGYRMDAETEGLARAAAQGGATGTVSGPRVRHELFDLLAEPESAAGVERLRDLGLDRGLHADMRADPELAAGAAMGASETGADRVLAQLAALVSAAPAAMAAWVDDLGLDRSEADRTMRAARRAPDLAAAIREDPRPSGLYELLSPEPPEALALALALGAPGKPVLRYVSELARISLDITGDDLLAAGVPESPAIGLALSETLRRKLDGELGGREEELAAALELAHADGADGGGDVQGEDRPA